MLQKVRAKKVDKKWGSLSSSCCLPEIWSLNCPKVHFLQFCADLSKKPKSVKAIYIYETESSDYTLSENDIVYRGLSHRS